MDDFFDFDHRLLSVLVSKGFLKDRSSCSGKLWSVLRDEPRSLVYHEKDIGYKQRIISFLSPLLNSVITSCQKTNFEQTNSPLLVVLEPTWLEVEFVYKMCRLLLQHSVGVKCCKLYAPDFDSDQYTTLLNGVDVLICTTMALSRIISLKVPIITMSRCTHLVIDVGQKSHFQPTYKNLTQFMDKMIPTVEEWNKIKLVVCCSFRSEPLDSMLKAYFTDAVVISDKDDVQSQSENSLNSNSLLPLCACLLKSVKCVENENKILCRHQISASDRPLFPFVYDTIEIGAEVRIKIAKVGRSGSFEGQLLCLEGQSVAKEWREFERKMTEQCSPLFDGPSKIGFIGQQYVWKRPDGQYRRVTIEEMLDRYSKMVIRSVDEGIEEHVDCDELRLLPNCLTTKIIPSFFVKLFPVDVVPVDDSPCYSPKVMDTIRKAFVDHIITAKIEVIIGHNILCNRLIRMDRIGSSWLPVQRLQSLLTADKYNPMAVRIQPGVELEKMKMKCDWMKEKEVEENEQLSDSEIESDYSMTDSDVEEMLSIADSADSLDEDYY